MTEQDRKRLVWGLLALACVVCGLFLLRRLPAELGGARPDSPRSSKGGEQSATVAANQALMVCRTVSGAKDMVVGQRGESTFEGIDSPPFATELGGASADETGFWVGIKRKGDKGSLGEVLFLGADGVKQRAWSLGSFRADVGPPLVATSPAGTRLALALEPQASMMAWKVVVLDGAQVRWGAEIALGATESFGAALWVDDKQGLIAYENVVEDGKRAAIALLTVDPSNGRTLRKAVIISRPEVDAEMPRLLATSSGLWLLYIARSSQEADGREGEGGQGSSGRYDAQRIAPSWLEAVRLGADGARVGQPLPITDQEGHVLTYDVAAVKDGSLLVAWRDDDTPVGSSGGVLHLQRVGASGEREPVLELTDGIGSGSPTLLGSWLAHVDRSERLMLTRLNADGSPVGSAKRVQGVERGQFVAVRGDDLLVAEPVGAALRLRVVRCSMASTSPASSAPKPKPASSGN